jgi:hypothetical protein
MISIYQRSVPAHPIKRMGRADPTICIAGCSKGEGRGRKGKRGKGCIPSKRSEVRLGVSRKERRATLDRWETLLVRMESKLSRQASNIELFVCFMPLPSIIIATFAAVYRDCEACVYLQPCLS